MDASRPYGRVFISYRRGSTSYPVNWLYDLMVTKFGNDLIFKDVDNILPGEDFVERLTSAVISCDVLLAVIGPDWLTVSDGHGNRRLDDPTDWVRLEVEIALARGVRVIPLLVESATMPSEADLPPKLLPLLRRQAHELSPRHFKRDAELLIGVVDDVLNAKKTPNSRGQDQCPVAPQPNANRVAQSPSDADARDTDRTVLTRSAAIAAAERPAPPRPDASGSSDSRRPRLWVVVGGAALAIVVLVVGMALINPPAGSSIPETAPTSRSVTSELPQSAEPLPNDVLVLRVSQGVGVWQIVTADLRGTILNTLAEGGDKLLSPVISRDRKTVLYRDERGGVRTLYAVSADGKLRRGLFSDGAACRRILRPALTSENLLVMPCGGGSSTKPETLKVLSVDGQVIRTIDEGAHMGDVTVSPDGSLVIYWRDESKAYPRGGGLFSAPLRDSSSRRRLTTGAAGQDAQPVISPDGDRVIFSRLEDGRRSLQVLDHRRPGVDNFGPLMMGTSNEEDPSWSPDGSWVAFRAGEPTDAKRGFTETGPLFMVSATGDSPRQISLGADIGVGPAWSSR